MSEVTPLLKQKVKCACGLAACDRYGTPNKDGCVRGCPCRRCLGRRNRRKGLSKQSQARKALGVQSQKFGDANEERWADSLFANEVKAGAQIRPAVNAWLRIEAQIVANEPDFGRANKHPRAVLMPDGFPKDEGLVMVRLSTWRTLIRPALEEYYGES